MNISNYSEIACGKVKNNLSRTFVLSILSGIILSFACLASTVISSSINNYSVAKCLSALVFPFGLILIVLMKTELFTGNCLLIIPFLDREVKFREMIKNLLMVYIGNLIGSIIIAVLIYNTPLVNTLGKSFINIINTKISFSIKESIILAILCNFLVCIAIYLSSICKDVISKIFVIFIPIFLFIILSFEHSVANMFYLSIGYLVDSSVTIYDILFNNLLPVTFGNVIGGMFLGILIWFLKEK